MEETERNMSFSSNQDVQAAVETYPLAVDQQYFTAEQQLEYYRAYAESCHNMALEHEATIENLTRENAALKSQLSITARDVDRLQRQNHFLELGHSAYAVPREIAELRGEVQRLDEMVKRRGFQIWRTEVRERGERSVFVEKEKNYVSEIAVLSEETEGRIRKIEQLEFELLEKGGTILRLQNEYENLRSEVLSERVSREETLAWHEELGKKAELKIEECQQLQTKLVALETENATMSEKLSETEDRMKLLEIIANFARRIRLRFFHSGLKGYDNWVTIEDGNRAAHDGDVIIDAALFSLGILDPSELTCCETKYGSFIGKYIGSHGKLKPLLDSSHQTKLLNMHAYLDSELKFGTPNNLEDPLARFRKLEGECQNLRSMLDWTTGGEEEARKAFEESPEVGVKLEEMGEIVRMFQRSGRRDSRGEGANVE
jgi:hypothetical protein